MTESSGHLRTWLGSSAADSITLAGRDLPSEIMGRLTLTELTYLLVTRRQPSPPQTRMLDAVLVALADHGLTPSALATRLTASDVVIIVVGTASDTLDEVQRRIPGLRSTDVIPFDAD